MAAVALFPRLGWIVTAVALVAVVSVAGHATRPLLLAAALRARSPLLLHRHGTLWSVPALAPLLGRGRRSRPPSPPLAGRAPTWPARAALGALGAWWWLLSEALDDGTDLQTTVNRGGTATARLLYLAVWAAAAALLPWIVRGRWLALDLVAASVWAAALGACTAAVHTPAPPGLVLAARPRGGPGGRRPPLPSCSSGGAVTLGRILCTGNHGHHIPVAGHERPAQP